MSVRNHFNSSRNVGLHFDRVQDCGLATCESNRVLIHDAQYQLNWYSTLSTNRC